MSLLGKERKNVANPSSESDYGACLNQAKEKEENGNSQGTSGTEMSKIGSNTSPPPPIEERTRNDYKDSKKSDDKGQILYGFKAWVKGDRGQPGLQGRKGKQGPKGSGGNGARSGASQGVKGDKGDQGPPGKDKEQGDGEKKAELGTPGPQEVSQGSTGLAFSGGGIRSAAFCSGVLSRLLESEVEVDYLSCVSGGGYTGTAYLDWKYHEESKDKGRRQGEGEGGWHKEFFEHMKQRSGYICDWTNFCGGCWDTAWFVLFITLHLIVPVLKWAFFAFPVAFIIDLFVGDDMRQAEDCDAALERQREEDATAVPDTDFIIRCLSGSHKRYITNMFIGLFTVAILCYFITSKCLRKGNCVRSFLLLIEYSTASMFTFTFIPFTIYDFFVKIPVWTQVFVGIIAVIVWVTIPFLRRKTSYVLIVYAYSFVIYWKVFRVDLPVLFIRHEDHLFHWLLLASGIFLLISSLLPTNLRREFAHGYNRWRLQQAFYHTNSTSDGCLRFCPPCLCQSKNGKGPLTLADLRDTMPEYISNIVVNRWKNDEKDKKNYTLLTMSPTGIERFDQHGKRQFEGKLEPKDIMLSEAMATSAAALSKHMGKYEESIEGLTRLYTILGLEMGATKKSDKCATDIPAVCCICHCDGWCSRIPLGLLRGVPLVIPTIYYYADYERFESSSYWAMIAFLLIHLFLVAIAIFDSGCKTNACSDSVSRSKRQPEEEMPLVGEGQRRGYADTAIQDPESGCCQCETLRRCCTVQSSFVFNARLLFSKDTIGPTPPAVLLLSDGGHYENLAILPLLQRKLKRIVVVDGGYKDEEEAYGDSILDALMLARSELNCSFYGENDEDVIADLMQMFVKPRRKEKPRYYKFKVRYGKESGLERDGEIILLVPRKSHDSARNPEELTFCCCECCHSKSCHRISECCCNAFPQHSTANQFFTPRMFEAYHEEGRRACEEADKELKIDSARDATH